MKFVLLVVLTLVAWALLKKTHPGAPVAQSGGPRSAPRKPLNDAQQTLYLRLQSALPSTMVLVQPMLSQLFEARGDDATCVVDFAICKRDATPLGVVLLDTTADTDRVEALVMAAGLRVARFRSARLPNDQDIKDALGFL